MLILRRPSAATLVAIVVTLAIGTQAGLAARRAGGPLRSAAVTSVEVTAPTLERDDRVAAVAR